MRHADEVAVNAESVDEEKADYVEPFEVLVVNK
jgi:hypothetical protein